MMCSVGAGVDDDEIRRRNKNIKRAPDAEDT